MKHNRITVINQDPGAITDRLVPGVALPILIKAMQNIERYTGHRWKVTSYVRQSPSHKTGYALDIAPDISRSYEHLYAVNLGSDPVLYKRVPMLRALQRYAKSEPNRVYTIGVFIEPDHLHLQLFDADGSPEIRIFKWKQPKPVYSDTHSRMKLPLIL